ncbi:hypothetical protein AAMO2058_001388500 [Amorphochlora amoebiformis]
MRLSKELKDLMTDKTSNVKARLLSDSMTRMECTFPGPRDTPYENGTFVVDVEIPSRYPFEPPKIRFNTRVWHPNISSKTGVICVDILKDQWSPTLTIKTAILSIQALMSNPVPKDPQDAVVARQYLSSYEDWRETASMWTEKHAMVPTQWHRVNSTTSQFVEMGFPLSRVLSALEDNYWNREKAIEALLAET